jgi:hypothetical protein
MLSHRLPSVAVSTTPTAKFDDGNRLDGLVMRERNIGMMNGFRQATS